MKISVSNFMAFKNKYDFDLGKINLFVGANNTGKSTLAKFFQWMKLNSDGIHIPSFMTHNNILNSDENQAKIIRRFSDLIHEDSECKEIEIVFSTMYFGNYLTFEFIYENYEGSTNSINEHKVGPMFGSLQNLRIIWGDLKLYEKKGRSLETFHFSNFAIIINKYLRSTDFNEMEVNYDIEEKFPEFVIFMLNEYLDNPLYDNFYDEPDRIITDLNKAGTQEFNMENDLLDNLDISSQGFLYRESIQQNTFELLAKMLKEFINVVLSKLFYVKIIKQTTLLDDDSDTVHFTNNVLSEYFNLKFNIDAKLDKNGNYFGNTTYIQQGGKSRQIDDMGDGIKNILPILNNIIVEGYDEFLINSFNRKKSKTFFISEPENAIHPNWQKKFIDYLVDNPHDKYIVETHSLIMVRSLQLAVAEGRISANDVAIYDFFEEEDGSKSMLKISILPDGQLDGKFMNGFDDLVNDMELKLWRISQEKLRVN